MTAVTVLRRRLSRLEREAAQCRASEESWRRLMDDVTDYAIIGVDPNGFITNWSRGAQRCFGFAAGEMLGQDVSRLRVGGCPAAAREAFAAARRDGHTLD